MTNQTAAEGAVMADKTAASPSEAAQRVVIEVNADLHRGCSVRQIAENIQPLLDSFARVEVLRGRLDENSIADTRVHLLHLVEHRKRRDFLQAQLKEAEEG